MATYRTPDVYIEEISLYPPSVAEVETAIPAFIGYTQKAEKDGIDLTMKSVRIESLVEYEQYFGFGPPVTPTVMLDEKNSVAGVDLGTKKFYLYDSMRLFFNNGGGRCYIVSVGDYNTTPSLGNDSTGILGGLKRIEKEDEPTIILCPDATLLTSTGLYDFQQAALRQCAKLQDRVIICDLKSSGNLKKDVDEFREKIGINNLKYGVAYVPWLKTSFSKQVYLRDITLKRVSSGAVLSIENLTRDQGIKDFITKELKAAISAVDKIKKEVINDNLTGSNKNLKEQLDSLIDMYDKGVPYSTSDDFQNELRDIYMFLLNIIAAMAIDVRNSLTDTSKFRLKNDLTTIFKNSGLNEELKKMICHHNAPAGFTSGGMFDTSGTLLSDTIAAVNNITGSSLSGSETDSNINSTYSSAATDDERGKIAKVAAAEIFSNINTAVNDLLTTAVNYELTFNNNLADLFSIYKNIITGINDSINEVPPSGAIAGIYATNDRDRGVWKAPANISLTSVIGPATRIDSRDQEELNVDVNAGKSINAIRAFTGKGTLVWGARTLAGNDNEWRYVSVRRFFNMVEESIKKSTYWSVFEPNDANTWIKVKSMIENYLLQKWREGALAGAKPDDAFFVKVGLGVTMTAQDILEGRMNIEIGMAVVRPAEFIILKFSHKMQRS